MIHHKHWYLPNFVLCFLFFIFRKDFGLIRALSLLAGKEEEDDKVEGTQETIFSALLWNVLCCKSFYNKMTSSGGAEVSLVPLLELIFPLSQMTSDEVLTYTTLPKQLVNYWFCLHNIVYSVHYIIYRSHCSVKVISLHPRAYVLAVCRKVSGETIYTFLWHCLYCIGRCCHDSEFYEVMFS